jgi:transposase
MRRRQLKALWRWLGQLQQMKLTARELLLKLSEAKGRYRAAWRLMDIQFHKPTTKGIASFSFALNGQKLRIIRRRGGRYLLRTNLLGRDPAQLWQFYILLVEIEAGFKNLKDDLVLRPIFHQLERRIEAHIFVAFMA